MSVAGLDNESEFARLAKRIAAGDPRAEEELVRRYEGGVSIIIRRIVQCQISTDDISQDTFIKVIEKIRHGDLREPDRLSGFVCGVAKNLAIEHVRRVGLSRNREESGIPEEIWDPAPSALTQLLDKEREAAVRAVIDELQVERDRDLLLRYYIGEEPKDKICADLGLTREQFSRVIFRALKRFKKLYVRMEEERRRP